MSTNISKLKREDLLAKIKDIRTFISSAPQDENTANLLSYLSDLEKDVNGKKYGLVFEEHREEIDEVLDTHTPVLTEDENLFIDNGGQMNFLIEGDNLASLQLLEKTHKGKIDLIYIDPPYNTGKKDFRYDDTFVEQEDAFRHSKWVSFIYKRFILARKLLSKEGIIFISVDDNEFSAMKMLCDEIFGEDNRVATLVWKKRYQGAKEKHIVVCHEYLLMYCKEKALLPSLFVPSDDTYAKKYFKQSDEYGSFRTQPLEAGKSMDDRENLRFPITAPDGTLVYPKRQWIWSKEHVEEGISQHIIGFSKTKQGEWSVFIKQYLNDESGNQRKTKQFSIIDGIYTQHGTKEIEAIFGDGNIFKFPKPSNLICKVLDIVPFEKDFTVLDFFAGSGTTAHAVLKYNKANDNINRRFILCTNNENNICREVTYERIKRVIDKEGYAASLKYYKVDYVPVSERMYYEYADELLSHIRELVELENGINFIGNEEIGIVLTEEELDNFISQLENNTKCRKLYLGHDVLMDAQQAQVLRDRKITINIIPDYYYKELEG
ncbi:MAG: site-specific DNA-methyltransferase [Oscillospiraceae bacterium]|jgi:adenine-specific DNA-methyltransferase